MIVALRTSDGQPQKDRTSGVDAINDRFNTELFRVGSPFFIDQSIAVEPRGNKLLKSWFGKQITGDLLDGEPVERQIFVERVDHPVAVLPDRTRLVASESV